MEYLREFETQAQCDAYVNGSDYKEPFIGFVDATSGISYNKVVPPTPPPSPYNNMYLTLDFKYNDPTTQSGTITSDFEEDLIFYSLDNGETWTDFYGEPVTVQNGDKLLLKGNINASSTEGGTSAYIDFSGIPKFDAYGNTMSLFYGDDFINKTAFPNNDSNLACLFKYGSIVSAENLILPATTLVDGCYFQMFCDCTSLTTAPSLSATTLANNCYQYMFQGCTSLTTAPELPATTLTNNCYENMFQGCTSLTTAPELPATTLTNYCYDNMFYCCSNLNYIKCLATDISADSCIYDWVNGVSSTGTFVKDANMSNWTTGTHGIPTNWTIQDAS